MESIISLPVMRRAIVACTLSLIAVTATAQWRAIETRDAMTDEIVRSASSLSGSVSFTVMRVKDMTVWAGISINDSSRGLIAPDTVIKLRVDSNKVQEFQKDESLTRFGIPSAFIWKPKFVTFKIWHGDDAEGRAPIVTQLMTGDSLIVRYIDISGEVNDVRFSLKGAGNAISNALRIPMSQSAADAATEAIYRRQMDELSACGSGTPDSLECMKAMRDCPSPKVDPGSTCRPDVLRRFGRSVPP